MRKLSSILVACILIFSLSMTAFASSMNQQESSRADELRVASDINSDALDILAAKHLNSMKQQFSNNSMALGFLAEELSNSVLGTPFTIYVFNDSGEVVSSDSQVYPVMYNNEIVALIEISYDDATASYCYTFGKAYAESLNQLRYENNVDTDKNLIIGRIADKLFLTDGKNVDVIFEMPIDNVTPFAVEDLENLCTVLSQNIDASYSSISESCVSLETNEVEPYLTAVTPRSYPNPLPVPHVKQTDVCGVAAWASVLNYRFGTSYTNNTLATAMANGYTNGSSGIPNMADYKNYANDVHNAGCTVASNLTFAKMKNCINNGKPIMGSWYSGSGSSKLYHAVLITGYVQNSTANYTYILKNPWYTYTQTTTVINYTYVTYTNAGVTWTLSSVVH